MYEQKDVNGWWNWNGTKIARVRKVNEVRVIPWTLASPQQCVIIPFECEKQL